MSALELPDILKSFLNQKVEVTEEKKTVTVGGGGFKQDVYRVAPEDTTIKALRKAATQCGLKVEICFPGRLVTCDVRRDRLRATITKSRGQWTVAKLTPG